MADAIREFNEYVRQDSRVDVLALPFRDGVTIITRRCGAATPPACTEKFPDFWPTSDTLQYMSLTCSMVEHMHSLRSSQRALPISDGMADQIVSLLGLCGACSVDQRVKFW